MPASVPTNRSAPLVSVVIPTRNRPQLLLRAVKCALSQTYGQIDVIVVIDGPDNVSLEVLSTLSDSRLRRLELPASRGANGARNAGVDAARGEWIALLDDDDEWSADKLEQQVTELAGMRFAPSSVISCRFAARSPEGDSIWPRRFPEEGESIGDYMFNRRSLFDGEVALNTSTLLVARDLAIKTRFSETVRKHQDVDFLLRASDLYPLKVKFVPECLAVWNVDDKRRSITSSLSWSRSIEWVRSHRSRLTRSAYSGFLLISLASEAAREHAWRACMPILVEAVVHGRPTLRQVLRFFIMWLVPSGLRRRLRIVIRESQTIKQTC